MALGEIYKVGILFTDSSGGTTNLSTGFHVRQDTTNGFDVNDVGDEVKAWWNTASGGGVEQKAMHSLSIELQEITLRKVLPLSPTIDSYTTGLPIAGSDAATTLPRENAILFSLRTANIGRSYRGRMFLPPPSEGDVADQLTAAAALDATQQLGDLFVRLRTIGALGAADARAVVYSRTLGLGTPITNVRCDVWIRSQRRRNVRTPSYQATSI